MAQAKPIPKPVRPRGKVKQRTDNERTAQTTPDALRELMDEASADWRGNAPRAYSLILQSKAVKIGGD